MQSKAPSVAKYLAELPADRRAAVEQVRAVILKNIDPSFEEGMQYGMIGYYVPHEIFPAGYHCDPKQPLPFLGLASQKNHMAVYMMCMYDGTASAEKFRADWEKTGKKLDMGKCCIRFRKVEDLCLDLIGKAIKSVPLVKYVAQYEKLRGEAGAKSKPVKKGAKKAVPKKAAKKVVKKSKSAKKK